MYQLQELHRGRWNIIAEDKDLLPIEELYNEAMELSAYGVFRVCKVDILYISREVYSI